ncbi:glycoside hydrolase family 28 protein [Amycolatopsis sp. NPDC049868]|uniref:glycoside hydrolase family 28 protein n=1 Tax=Amycolatopsis sp. NPDC049868 TaxID=3363934 RepID=UPI0037ACF433
MRRRSGGALFTVFSLVAGLAVAFPSGAAAATFNVKDYGAKGNGTTVDSPAIDRAISAAAAARGGIVDFPPGTYLARTIHLKSDITLNLRAGAKIIASGSGMDAPEPNPYDAYQDFGHSHFRNALIWGENVENVAFTGTGTIDGADELETGENIPAGVADKMISLKLCKNVSFTDLTLRRGGHFALIANGCDGLKLNRVKVFSTDDRDGINFINSSRVELADSRIEASDDAVAFKSDYALGRTFVSENNVVRDSTILSTENNAVQFGSETCGGFRNTRFSNLTITGASKAGLGMVSMDGAVIEDVTFTDIKLTKTASPIFLHVGKRSRCPGNPPAGRIRNITYRNITGTDLIAPRDIPGDPEYASTISGRTDAPIENITFDNVKLTVPGGHPAAEADVVPPEASTTYPPRIFGKRPAYGFWLRHAAGIRFTGGEIGFDRSDGRPAFLTDDVRGISLDGVRVDRSGGGYDVVWRKSSGQSIVNSTTTEGRALRVRNR